MATEAIKIQLDTLQLEYQALQVENAKLHGENPQTAQEIDTEREELTVLKNEEDELRQNLHASREAEFQLSQQKEVVEEELSEVKKRIEQANEDFGGKEAATIQEITELREANGRLLLELKCAKQQLNCVNFVRLSAERNKVERLQVQLSTGRSNEASLRSAVEGTISSGSSPFVELVELTVGKSSSSEDVTTTVSVAKSLDLVSTSNSPLLLTSHTPSVQSAVTLLHPSQVQPFSKFSGSNENETFKEWHKQFELVATVCGWDSHFKLANLATRLQGQAYSFYRICTTQQRSTYDSLVTAMSQRFTPVRIQSVQSGLLHSRRQKVNEKVDDYAQDLSRLYQEAYPQAN